MRKQMLVGAAMVAVVFVLLGYYVFYKANDMGAQSEADKNKYAVTDITYLYEVKLTNSAKSYASVESVTPVSDALRFEKEHIVYVFLNAKDKDRKTKLIQGLQDVVSVRRVAG